MDSKEKIIEIMLKENDTNNILKELTDNNLLNEFDFSNDCCKKNYIEEKDTLYKYIKYKLSNIETINFEYERTRVLKENLENSNENKIPDADSKSKVLQLIYNKLYKEFLEDEDFKRIVTNKNNNIYGDTMNSVSTTLNEAINRIQLIYNKLYKEFLEDEDFKRIVTNKNNNIYGDTMNSVSTTLNEAINRILKANKADELDQIKNAIYYGIVDGSIEDIREELNSFKLPGWNCSIIYTTELYLNYDKNLRRNAIYYGIVDGSIEDIREELNSFKLPGWNCSIIYTTELYLNYDKNLRRKGISNFSLKKYLERIGAFKLIEVYHTLGNFIIIPKGWNKCRYSSLKDYWDLTLLCIYNYYFKIEDEKYCIEKISGKENKEQYEVYINTFESWEKFIKANFLESFVEIEKDENGKYSYGKPKELWEGHFEGELLPTNIYQCIDYFNNSSEWIKLRTELMIEYLKYVMNKEIVLNKIYNLQKEH